MNLIVKARLSAKAFHIKISFVSISMKTNFHNKNFAVSLAFIMRFTATRKWPIPVSSSPELIDLARLFPHVLLNISGFSPVQ